MDLAAGRLRIEELLPRTPWVERIAGSGWPCAANRIVGGGFVTETYEPTSYPAPTELGGVRVAFAGQWMPLVKVSPSEIVYQIPWEFPQKIDDLAEYPLRVYAPSDSPLLLPPLAREYPSRPEYDGAGAFHEDGQPVTLYRPVMPGEVIRLDATGLEGLYGVTGMPAPEPVTPIGVPWRCRVAFVSSSAETLSIALAPGRIGLYEIRLRMPDQYPDDYVSVRCPDSASATVRTGNIWLPVRP